MELESTLIKIKETAKTEKDFLVLVETMKRKASKGMIEGVSVEDIDHALDEIENPISVNTNTDFMVELDEADKYVDSYLDSLTEEELSHLLAEECCSLLNEGPVWDSIKNGAKAVGSGFVKAGTAVAGAFNPATGAALGPVIGVGAGLALGAAGIAAIVARLRRRRANVTESTEVLSYFNESDLRYITENTDLSSEMISSLLECDNDILVSLTEEIVNYSMDILVENYINTLDDTDINSLVEEIENEYSEETLNEEAFYHTRRYNRKMKQRYEEHPKRTAAAVAGVTTAAAAGTTLGVDAIVKDNQYKKDVANRTAAGEKAWNTANTNYNNAVADATRKGSESWNAATQEYGYQVANARSNAQKAWDATGKNEWTNEWLSSHGKSSINDLTNEEYYEYMTSMENAKQKAINDAGSAIDKNQVFASYGIDADAKDATMAGQNAGKAVDRNSYFDAAGANAGAETAAEAGALKGAEATRQTTLAQNVGNGIKTAAENTGKFIQSTPWVQGALAGVAAIGGAVLIAKLIKKIRERRAAKEKAQEEGELAEGYEIDLENLKDTLSENTSSVARTDRNKLYENYDLDRPIGEILMEDLNE